MTDMQIYNQEPSIENLVEIQQAGRVILDVQEWLYNTWDRTNCDTSTLISGILQNIISDEDIKNIKLDSDPWIYLVWEVERKLPEYKLTKESLTLGLTRSLEIAEQHKSKNSVAVLTQRIVELIQ